MTVKSSNNIQKSYKESHLSVVTLERLKGREYVSKQFISDLTNSSYLKQVERDLIRNALKDEPNTINVERFSKKVRADLLPLKVNKSFLVGEDLTPSQARTAIKKGKSIYGLQEFMGEIIQSDKPLKLAQVGDYEGYIKGRRTGFTPRYDQVSLPSELRGEVKSYQERIYESPVKTTAGTIHFSRAYLGNESGSYFGHTRIEDMADNQTRRVIEVQSDLYQRGNLEKEKAIPIYDKTHILYDENQQYGSQDGKIVALKERNDEVTKLQQYNNPTAHYRMIREEIRNAAIDGNNQISAGISKGITKLQFPTGETAMNIEGLGVENKWVYPVYQKNGTVGHVCELSINDLSKGKEIIERGRNGGGERWIIIQILGDGKFTAIPKQFEEQCKTGHNAEGYPFFMDSVIETFDISNKVDTSNPVYKFYEKDIGHYLTSKYGAQIEKDSKGVTWFEVHIKPEMASQPVLAFGDSYSDFAHLRQNLNPKSRNPERMKINSDIKISKLDSYNKQYQILNINNALKQKSMEKESNPRKTTEAQIFLQDFKEHVEEFITGNPTKIEKSEISKKTATEQQELASVRAIRARYRTPIIENTKEREAANAELETTGFKGFINALEKPTREAQAMSQGDSDKDEVEHDYE